MAEPVEHDDDDEPDDVAEPARHRIVVDAEHAGDRLDATIAATTALSRAVAQRLIDDGHVRLGGFSIHKAGQRLRAGDVIDVTVPAPEPIELVAEDIPLAVLFEDRDVIVIDKPAGLVVHPAAGHARGTLVNALMFHCKDLGGIGGELRPGIVHRLDKDTSGVMIVAKTEAAHAGLTAAFAAKSRGETGEGTGQMSREYLAIGVPGPTATGGTIRTLHGRHPTDRKRFSSKVASGKPAVTHYQVIERFGRDAALVRLRLETGRTHQIRVHAADQGWPLLGDTLYGKPPRSRPVGAIGAQLGRQALHAAVLAFTHPTTGAPLRFESPLPADLATAIAALRALG
ncbi:MAG TPA: RluA family pseudouridine synthase [Kofleriaceae bacterium]|nr:RluA family pseudouridine synthase [Kofleriaceae bacterium]